MGYILQPGPRKPNVQAKQAFAIEVGTNNAVTEWRPFGPYQYARFQFARNIPRVGEIRVPLSHPMASTLLSIRRRTISIRLWYNGIPWDGRVMTATCKGRPGSETVTAYCISNWVWMQSMLAWPQPLFPRAEFQFPKHDIGFGPVDGVIKYFVARNAARLNVPVYAQLPLRYDIPDLPDLNKIRDLDSLLDYIADSTQDLCAVWARMTQMDELFKTHIQNSERELTVRLWRPGDPDPGTIFNADNLAHLENIISFEGLQHIFYFLNPGNILGLVDPSKWLKATEPCYLVDTREKRDRRHMEWRVTPGGPIVEYERNVAHPEGWQVIVGGKAPEWANKLVELGINLLIQGVMSLLNIGGAAPSVGDLFDDIFLAYNQFTDPELKAELLRHGLPEKFADNTNAFSLDALAAGTQKLKDIGGQDGVKLTVATGLGGYGFGVDDGSGLRFGLGDIMTFTHAGTSLEQHVETVEVEDDPKSGVTETVTLGDDLQLRSAWDRAVGRLGELGGAVNAIANSTN